MNTLPRDGLATTADPWETAVDAAFDLDRYAPGWDGEGADPVSEQLIRDTVEFLRHMRRMGMTVPSCLYPVADGTVMLEMPGHRSGEGMSINLRPGKRVEVLCYAPGVEPMFEAFTLDDGEPADSEANSASGAPPREADEFHTFVLAA